MAYDPQIGSNIILALAGEYVPPDGGHIVFSNVVPPPVPQQRAPDFSAPWEQLPLIDVGPSPGWKDRHSLTTTIGMGWIKRLIVDTEISATWLEKGSKDINRQSTWGESKNKFSRPTGLKWRDKNAADLNKSTNWETLSIIHRSVGNGIFSPPPKEIFKRIIYERSQILDLALFVVPWGNPPPKDKWHRTVWGTKFYHEICWRNYESTPGDALNFNLHVPIGRVDDGDHIRFIFDQFTYDRRCRWREQSGWRDAYFYIKPGLIPTGPWATVYTMLNTTSLTRLPERTPIDVTSMTIATDWDSLYWTIKATIGSDASLAVLEPAEDGPMLIEAAINGHLWKLQAERWATGHAFGQRSRTIDGRSISAQLGAPMAGIRTYTETEARTAAQLISYELEDTGWTASLQVEDWSVPANVHSYQDQTPMQVIKGIADTCRAIVQTHMVNQSIAIKPRYKVKPWLIATATPDLIIPASMAARIDGEWDERPVFNSVYVSGEAGGISATITREGSAGDLLAPMVTSKLITATEVARELGIVTLGGSGRWSKHRIELPVFAAPAVPGIILPGSIIEYNLGLTSWRGFVSAVSVNSQRTKDGLKVRQTIDVERYHGN